MKTVLFRIGKNGNADVYYRKTNSEIVNLAREYERYWDVTLIGEQNGIVIYELN